MYLVYSHNKVDRIHDVIVALPRQFHVTAAASYYVWNTSYFYIGTLFVTAWIGARKLVLYCTYNNRLIKDEKRLDKNGRVPFLSPLLYGIELQQPAFTAFPKCKLVLSHLS